MIAYMQDNSTIFSRLTAHLLDGSPPNFDKHAVKDMPTSITGINGDVSYTVHNRDFEYIHRPNEMPGRIKLIHIGLK